MELTPNYWLVGALETATSSIADDSPRFFIDSPSFNNDSLRFSTENNE